MMQSCKGHVIQFFPFAPVLLVLRMTGGAFSCPSFCFFLPKTCCFFLWLPLWPCPNCVILSSSSAFLARGKQCCWISSDLLHVLLPQSLSRSFEMAVASSLCMLFYLSLQWQGEMALQETQLLLWVVSGEMRGMEKIKHFSNILEDLRPSMGGSTYSLISHKCYISNDL